MTLTKADMIDSINENISLPRHECSRLVESLLEIIKKALESGEDVLISGFGKFCVKDKRKRRGRNPATGEDLMLEARKCPFAQTLRHTRKNYPRNINYMPAVIFSGIPRF
ncbi:MAG: integration host factor subunit alpha [Deltaproteobacteria bacterium]|nr:integration host factor subunit alpha [Deltaproteobacteria bacterium]